jgi:hypothetical protein
VATTAAVPLLLVVLVALEPVVALVELPDELHAAMPIASATAAAAATGRMLRGAARRAWAARADLRAFVIGMLLTSFLKMC